MNEVTLPADTDNGAEAPRKRMPPQLRRWLLIVAGALLAALVGLAFVGYSQPELLMEAINLRYCS